MAEIQKSFSDLTVAEIYFNKEQDGTYNLAVKFDNGQWGSTNFAKDSYDQVVETFKTSLAVDDEVIIDTEWAISMIDKQM